LPHHDRVIAFMVNVINNSPNCKSLQLTAFVSFMIRCLTLIWCRYFQIKSPRKTKICRMRHQSLSYHCKDGFLPSPCFELEEEHGDVHRNRCAGYQMTTDTLLQSAPKSLRRGGSFRGSEFFQHMCGTGWHHEIEYEAFIVSTAWSARGFTKKSPK